ncbi:hypothetical protein PtA15_16A355 [Puccinia triticina]|uniref:Uncharacterized protein n=1 Tax=Puccinia triticina TaxID=208348 RepID=A0ABY7D836_9BASI|nr:uncharacterized protein PtA15_16A355 [Puccinia triticina]WAQ92447.1 hypothetical protein PtA15_16A355 [Puccinia triticina]
MEKSHRNEEAKESLVELEKIAHMDARDDFKSWIHDAAPFPLIMENSLLKYRNGSEALRLRQNISISIRAAGYLEEIILMAKKAPKMTAKKGDHDIEMEAMGETPTVEKSKLASLNDNDWILIRREEAQQGDFFGKEWSILQPL